MKKKFNLYELLEIKWVDSVGRNDWIDSNDINFGDNEILTHFSIGYFLNINEMTISIAQSMQKKIYSNGGRMVDHIMELPIRSILKIKKVSSVL